MTPRPCDRFVFFREILLPFSLPSLIEYRIQREGNYHSNDLSCILAKNVNRNKLL